MKKHRLTILLVLGLSAAVALAQSTAPGQPPSAADPGAQGSMQGAPPSQMPDRTGAASQSGAQTQSSDSYGTMNSDKDKDKDQDKKASSMANVDDESLHRQIHEQLAGNPDLQNVQITVKNGKVTLEGSVPKKEDKKQAERLAKAVPGVKGVKDRLSVSASASSGSASNVGGVAGAATATGSAPGENQSGAGIAAHSQSTTSTTGASSGTAAPSASTPPSSASPSSSTTPPDQSTASTQSSSSATSPSGQTSTADQSATGAQSQSGSMGAGASTDDQLQQQIQTALKNDPTLANDSINVTLAADSITLSGEVASGKEKKTAQRIAESYAGNRKVKNDITVGGKGAGSMSSNPSEKPSGEKPPKE